VTTASAAMEIVQDFVNFVNDQTSTKDGFDPASIENVVDEEISRGLMVNALMIISRDMRPKIICSQVDEEIVVPWIIKEDEEEVLVRKIHIDGGRFSI
jgi:hypothetical protein